MSSIVSSLRDQIAAALMPPSGAFVMAGIEAQADAVMAVVQPELDQLIEIQVIDLQVAASIAQHEQQRAEQAEAERDKVQADLEAYTTDVLSVLAKKNTALEKAVAAIDQARRACDDIEAEAHRLFGDGNRPSNVLGRANGMLHAANRIRTALDKPEPQ